MGSGDRRFLWPPPWALRSRVTRFGGCELVDSGVTVRDACGIRWGRIAAWMSDPGSRGDPGRWCVEYFEVVDRPVSSRLR